MPLRPRISFKRNYVFLFVTQLLLIFFAPFLTVHESLMAVFLVLSVGMLGAILIAVGRNHHLRWLILLAGVILVFILALALVPDLNGHARKMVLFSGAVGFVLFYFFTIVSLISHIFGSERITADRLIGSVCVYLMIGIFFAFLYFSIETFAPNSFQLSAQVEDPIHMLHDMIFVSFASLTTIGPGNLQPLTPGTRMLLTLEAICGSLYLVIMVSSLVSMHLSHRHSEPHR